MGAKEEVARTEHANCAMLFSGKLSDGRQMRAMSFSQ
jgi:hypothetical protein